MGTSQLYNNMADFVSKVDTKKVSELTDKHFDTSVVNELCEYIKIPNLSPAFDAEWNTNGRLEEAAEHLKKWVLA